MDTKKIRVRKEVVRCDMCKQPKEFIYLSDFAYGKRLIYFINELDFAFVDLLEDEFFLEYENIVQDIFKQNNIICSSEEICDFISRSFGITCDDINGMKIDFSIEQKRCLYCGSTNFERELIEPESLTEITVPIITHKEWKILSRKRKEELICFELKKDGLL